MELSQPGFVVFAFVLGFFLMFLARFILMFVFGSLKLIVAFAIIGIALNLSMPKESLTYNKLVSKNIDYGLSKMKAFADTAKNELMQYNVSLRVNKKDLAPLFKKS